MQSIKSSRFTFPKQVNSILVAVPHPDDETAFAGTIIRRAVSSGINVRVVTLTRGEKSTLRYGLRKTDDLAGKRSLEFARAMQLLGVKSHHMYAIPDGEIENNLPRTEEIVRAEIDSHVPDLLLTLEPWGIYGHPDHIALSRLITKINHGAGLGYLTVTPGYIQSRATIHMARHPELVQPIMPHIEISLSPAEILAKLQVIRAHRSQFSITPLFLYNWYKRRLLTHEYLHYAN